MAGTSTIEVKCAKCKKVYEAPVVDHIDLSEDRDLVKGLKTGKANRTQCPKCKKVNFVERSIVINFEPQSLIVLFDSKAKSKAKKELLTAEYNSVIGFNEALSEVGSETEFSVISDLTKLKKLIAQYMKVYG